ncbi:hypothetical protein [Paludisphaera soli]|uniref:hypothetical protein n=1 Tax=Paludisphaera soli TaxID=2712865 RepID=UPI0013EDE7AE|nr:hypothetical protein [Paludisphaera soli]
MDGEFACPECGQTVKVRRLGPGRQVRCGFCNRLLEVPFLPRVDGGWKRTRFTRPRWVPWAWWTLALALMGVVGTAGVQLLVRGERAARVRAIDRLIESSKAHEAEGRLDLALIDLDSALEVAPAIGEPLDDAKSVRERRRDLARRDVGEVLRKLESEADATKPVGGWLNLVARVGADRDLAPIRKEVESRFLEVLNAWVDEAARRAAKEPDPNAAFVLCGEGADLAIHLPPPDQEAAQARLRDIVAALVGRSGVVVESAPGEYVVGTPAGYDQTFRPQAVEALRAKGYLPPPKTSRWSDLWSAAPYRFVYTIRERYEGTYLGTQNRLARIEARLTLVDRGRESWSTQPNARTIVPVPNLPSYLAGRLALSQDRNEEAERRLYDNALSQIRDRFRHALAIIPARPSTAAVGRSGGG